MVIAPVLDPEDLKELREAIKEFSAMGMKIPMAWAHSRWGIPRANDDEDVLEPVTTTPTPTTARLRQGQISMARTQSSPNSEQLINETLGIGLDDWQQVTAPILDPVRQAIQTATSYEEASENLLAAYPDMDAATLANSLRDAMQKARAIGDSTD